MRKKELLKLRALNATPKMVQLVEADLPQLTAQRYWKSEYTYRTYQYGLYMRCQVINGFLKVAFFLPEHIKVGGRMPFYELFIDKEKKQFLTYNRVSQKWLTGKLNMLPWPVSVYHCNKKWINSQGYNLIKNYLDVKHGGYSGLLEYQLKVRADELKRRYKKETDPWDLELEQTPELPKDWNRWVNKVGITENYIFYQYTRNGAKSGYCTFCEKEVPIQNPRHNKIGRCSCCRHAITYKSIGKAGTVVTPNYYMHLMQRCEDGFILREFTGYKKYRKGEYKTPECNSHEIRRALYDPSAKPINAYYWGLYKQSEFRWIRTHFCNPSWYNTKIGRVYGKTLPTLAAKELRCTGIVEALQDNPYTDPEKYFAILHIMPQLEQLAKAHLSALVTECLVSYYGFDNALKNESSSSLSKLLGIDSQQLKRLRENKGGRRFLTWLQYEKITGKHLPDETVAWFCKEEILPDNLNFIADRMSFVQIYNYMRRQMRETHMTSREVLATWSDYLSMACRLKMDTNDAIIYRVRKLRQRHDELVALCGRKDLALRAGEILKKYPHIEDICQEINPIYGYTGKDYTVIVPSRIEEIMDEGENLHHCVGSSDRYWERIERNESYILFLRKVSEPDVSYYTLEVEPDGTVRQKRTMYDRQKEDIKDAEKFLLEWQKNVSKKLTAKERNLAETSRILRNEEFAQMQKSQVVIHTGALRGKLLVDVLMADLMENKEELAETVLPTAA